MRRWTVSGEVQTKDSLPVILSIAFFSSFFLKASQICLCQLEKVCICISVGRSNGQVFQRKEGLTGPHLSTTKQYKSALQQSLYKI